MKNKVLNWIKAVGIKVAKTMAETALAVIGTNTIGITEVDWLGLLSACALSGIVTILFNIKSLPEKSV
ncbi:MAG: hypothetical protein IKJ93_00810 [Clostridia bacterium]|nr:hypothetical protein [Clostridia bacterium]